MKTLLAFLLSFYFCSCSGVLNNKPETKTEKIKKECTVRLTVYWKSEDGWTRKGKTSTGGPLQSYKTVAVDPKVFPYGSTIKFPELGLVTTAWDTGSAVKSRKASRKMGRNDPVIDLYIEKKDDAAKFIKDNPLFTKAQLLY